MAKIKIKVRDDGFLKLHTQHRYYVPTCCTYIAADVDPQRVWPVPECGAPVWGSSSFCETHHKRVYKPGRPIKLSEYKDALAEQISEDHEAESGEEQLAEIV